MSNIKLSNEKFSNHDLKSLLNNSGTTHSINIEANSCIEIHDNAIENEKLELIFTIKENAKLNYVLNTKNSKHDIERKITFNLEGSFAKAFAKCTHLGQKSQKFTITTVQKHLATQTTSNVEVRCVLKDNAQMRCDNLIHVTKEADNCQASQSSKCIMLSASSRAIAIPKLEIKNHKVKCNHGAAICRLNDEQIFYLESRGLDFFTTQKFLIDGFLLLS